MRFIYSAFRYSYVSPGISLDLSLDDGDAPNSIFKGKAAKDDVFCNREGNVLVLVEDSGRKMSYTYKCSDSYTQTTDSAMALIAGNYQAIVLHANGCQDSVLVNIAEPITIKMNASSRGDAHCYTFLDGQAIVSVTGGLGA